MFKQDRKARATFEDFVAVIESIEEVKATALRLCDQKLEAICVGPNLARRIRWVAKGYPGATATVGAEFIRPCGVVPPGVTLLGSLCGVDVYRLEDGSVRRPHLMLVPAGPSTDTYVIPRKDGGPPKLLEPAARAAILRHHVRHRLAAQC